MKHKNRMKRLNARIHEWEAIRATDTQRGGKVKLVNKASFTKPGSNKK